MEEKKKLDVRCRRQKCCVNIELMIIILRYKREYEIKYWQGGGNKLRLLKLKNAGRDKILYLCKNTGNAMHALPLLYGYDDGASRGLLLPLDRIVVIVNWKLYFIIIKFCHDYYLYQKTVIGVQCSAAEICIYIKTRQIPRPPRIFQTTTLGTNRGRKTAPGQ